MRKRSTGKSTKTDVVGAVIQDVELTVEETAEAARRSVKKAADALAQVVKSKKRASSGPNTPRSKAKP
jgi:hypothetical protein